MRRPPTLLALLLIGACVGTSVGGREADNAPVRRLTIHPAVEPKPALKYRLLPASYERTPGNAATVYKTAAILLTEQRDGPLMEKVSTWCKMPLKALPQDEVAEALSQFSDVLRHVELGAWREDCDWDWPLEEGAAMLLPDLGAYRDMARLLALKVRLQILERDYDAAMHTLETGFSFAAQVAEGPILINDLVGIAMTSLLLDAVEDLVQAPGAPSLYWALTVLPSPMIDVREAVEFELSGMALWPKELRDPEKAYLSPSQWAAVFSDFAGLVGEVAGTKGKLVPAGLALATYTDAKQHLIERGETPERVEGMAVLQVVAVYLRDGWRLRADEALKWWYTPYPQARADMDNVERIAAEAQKEKAGLFVALLMPALQKARLRQMQLDRRIAALRAIEAIRLYAGAVAGHLPERLDQIEQAPIPANPMRGEPFIYELQDDRAMLSAPLEPDDRPERALRYEIEIAR